MYTERSVLAYSEYSAFNSLYTDRCALSYEGKQRWPRPSRLVAVSAERAFGSRPRRQSCFTGTASAPTVVERLTEHANVSKRTLYQHFSSKNDLVEEYLHRIHHAGGMPSEQAIDTADAPPPISPSIAPRAAVSGVHFTTPLSRQGEM